MSFQYFTTVLTIPDSCTSNNNTIHNVNEPVTQTTTVLTNATVNPTNNTFIIHPQQLTQPPNVSATTLLNVNWMGVTPHQLLLYNPAMTFQQNHLSSAPLSTYTRIANQQQSNSNSQSILFTNGPTTNVQNLNIHNHVILPQINQNITSIDIPSAQSVPFTIPLSSVSVPFVENNNIKNNKSIFSPCNISSQTSTISNGPNNNITNNINIKEIQCDICCKLFKSSEELSLHNNIHNQNSLFCRFCGLIYKTLTELNKHLKIHTQHCAWKCQFCDRSFKQKHSLKDHIRTHTGERPFKCDYCTRAFKVKHNLTTHRRLHTGERPYICTLCPKKFASKSSLNGHSRKKHPEYWREKKLVKS